MREARLYLHIPAFEELDYRQRIMADPATMRYNSGYNLPIEGYDRETGCIAFPRSAWTAWYAAFIGMEPARFYAYIARKEDGVFVGEVNLHRAAEAHVYEMGVVIEGEHRGQGYGGEALELLLAQAFGRYDAQVVRNDFERGRSAALTMHLAAGFAICEEREGIVQLVMTRERYLARHPAVSKSVFRYAELTSDQIDGSLFARFIRRQVVTKCRRKIDGLWCVRDIAFIDDWSDADYAELVASLRHTVMTGGVVIGAWENGALKGFASVECTSPVTHGDYRDLTFLHVSEDCRGQGIGRALFERAKAWASAHGGRRLYISAHSAVETQAFYRAMGCVEAREISREHIKKEPCDCQLECETGPSL